MVLLSLWIMLTYFWFLNFKFQIKLLIFYIIPQISHRCFQLSLKNVIFPSEKLSIFKAKLIFHSCINFSKISTICFKYACLNKFVIISGLCFKCSQNLLLLLIYYTMSFFIDYCIYNFSKISSCCYYYNIIFKQF